MEEAHTFLPTMDRTYFPHFPLVRVRHSTHLEWIHGIGECRGTQVTSDTKKCSEKLD